jgi:hypothetical protein
LPDLLQVRYNFAQVNARYLFVSLALLFFVNAAAGGTYQRTKDGKTMVWNNYPQPGDAATWSGKRDGDGYATGLGTLTWFNAKPVVTTGSNIPTAKHSIMTSYSGTMVRGKLDGMVTNVDANGKKFHGLFANGRKTGKWITGPASRAEQSAIAAQPKNEPAPRAELVEPAAPAEGPPQPPQPPPPAAPTLAKEPPAKPPTAPAAKANEDGSLESIISPTSLSRMSASADSSPPSARSTSSSSSNVPSLTNAEAIDLADAAARTHGFNLDEFERPHVQYAPDENIWSISYDQQRVNGMSGMTETGKHFSVNIEDKTKKASLVPGR